MWIPISSAIRQIHPFSVHVTEIELQDKLFDFGPFSEVVGEIFDIKELPTRPYEKNDHVHIRISFERDLNKMHMERTAYGILDMLGDVGGLNDALKVLGCWALGLIQINALENYLVSLLYQEQMGVKIDKGQSLRLT